MTDIEIFNFMLGGIIGIQLLILYLIWRINKKIN